VDSKNANQALQDLVVDSMRRSQEAFTDVVRSWRAQWQGNPLGQASGSVALSPLITLDQVDAVFDLAELVLTEQRRITKELLVAAMPAPTSGSATGTNSGKSSG